MGIDCLMCLIIFHVSCLLFDFTITLFFLDPQIKGQDSTQPQELNKYMSNVTVRSGGA